jgi:hypothetical protein
LVSPEAYSAATIHASRISPKKRSRREQRRSGTKRHTASDSLSNTHARLTTTPTQQDRGGKANLGSDSLREFHICLFI